MKNTLRYKMFKPAKPCRVNSGSLCGADNQTISGSLMKNIRSCRLLNQAGRCVPAGASAGIVLSATRVQLRLSACWCCWWCRGLEMPRAEHLSRLSAHAWMRFWERCCHQPVSSLVVLVLPQGTAAAAVLGTVLCTL